MLYYDSRGYKLYYHVVTGTWDPDPPACAHCNREVDPDDPDPCWGIIPGATSACCGHGDPSKAYIEIPLNLRIMLNRSKWRLALGGMLLGIAGWLVGELPDVAKIKRVREYLDDKASD